MIVDLVVKAAKEKEQSRTRNDDDDTCFQLLPLIFCCPCYTVSVACLTIAVGRDNDNYCCACFGWDFLECRQESNSCFD